MFEVQGLRKEPELEGHVLLAQKYSDGWIPIQMLAIARPVTQWISKHAKVSPLSTEGLLQFLVEHLRQEVMTSTGVSYLEIMQNL